MKKYALFILCLMLAVGAGARVMTDFFISMPDSLMPMLNQNAKKDLIDFYKSDMKPILPNEWSANSKLVRVENNFIELSEDSEGIVTTSMAMLELKNRDTLLCMVRTIKTPQPDSEIFFFSKNWAPLKTQKYITIPTIDNFKKELGNTLVDYTQLTLQPQHGGTFSLEVTLDATDGQTDADADRTKHFVYRWNGAKFIKQQQ